MRGVIIWLAAIGLGLGLGVGSVAFLIVRGGAADARIGNGVWETERHAGDPATDPYSRARVAIFGLWALPPEEVIYYTAYRDKDGAVLNRPCRYEVRGAALPARWWSVTLYRDFFLIANEVRRYSWSKTALDAGAAPWTIQVNARGEGLHGLPMGDRDGVFALSLRLYQPAKGVLERRGEIDLPEIVKLDCAGANT